MTTTPDPATAPDRSSFVRRAVDWLRAGYPAGVPRQDYVVLLGVLRRTLHDGEIRQIAEAVADRLTGESGDCQPIGREDIERMLRESVLQHPSEQDVARVSAHLAAGGWPLAEPPSS